jgi:VIT1/CCC1 family predicted Fe2+/Mn2+ transporter
VAQPSPEDLGRYARNFLREKDGAALYRGLAGSEKDPKRAQVFTALAEAEEKHADRWKGLLEAAGAPLPVPRESARNRALRLLARVFTPQRVVPLLTALEAGDENAYSGQVEAAGLPAEEREHQRILASLRSPAPESIIGREPWHRWSRSGGLRAAVFGVNDGLVSNFSLVMGITGANASPGFVRLAGIAGLLGGAFSMAAGEYISMRVQRENLEYQIVLEEEELETAPEEEEEELALIFRGKGLHEAEAAAIAKKIMSDPKTAIDTLAREELGVDPSDLGSPWTAAWSSFVSFAIGASVPLLPYAVVQGSLAWWGTAVLSGVSLFGVGSMLSLLTAQGALRGGFRMLAVGLMAAGATYLIGHLLGVTLLG